jgi:oxygen-dependent protoporphyrinogen oxidase
MDADAIVIGGGIAGLSAGVELLDAGQRVLVLEAGDAPGGHFRAERADGYLFPHGPHAIPGFAGEAFELIERLGLDERLLEARGGSLRWVWLKNRRVALPSGPKSFLTSPFLSLGGKLRLASEPWRQAPAELDETESVADFFARRLGPEAMRALIAPFVSGIYAGDPQQLEVRSAFPKLLRWEREAGSLVRGAIADRRRARQDAEQDGEHTPSRRGLWSLPGGLAEVSAAAAGVLGDALRLSTPVAELAHEDGAWRVETESGTLRASRVVTAVPPPTLARLLAGVDDEASELAAGVPMAPVAVVHLGGPIASGETPPEGFGLLVPREAGFHTLGTVFSSALFPGRAPEGAWLQATYLGGVTDPGLLELDDEALRRTVADESRRLLGFEADGGVCRIFRHATAIPQLVAGHQERVDALQTRLASKPGLRACGNWLRGVGLQHAIESGRTAAQEVAP